MARPKSSIAPVVSVEVTYNPASLAPFNSVQITLTSSNDVGLSQIRTGYPVMVWAPSLEAGLHIDNAFASAAGTVKFTLYNNTGVAIDGASQSFEVFQF